MLIDREMQLLTSKKVIYVANVSEDDLATEGEKIHMFKN